MSPPPPSRAREGQPERGHFLAVPNEQEVANQYRVVPGLALDRREPRELPELVGGRIDERQLTLLRQHEQHVLVGQEDELAVAVASALPLALSVLEVDAGEDAAVEAEGMAFVNDDVVEVGLQPFRGPAFFDVPSAGSVRDRDAARADSPRGVGGAYQEVAVRDEGRLHDAEARPRMLPKERAVGRRVAGYTGFALQQDLLDPVDRQQLRRAVATAALRTEPARLTGGDVVGNELARGGDDDHVVDHERRAREPPARDLRVGVGRHVAGPHAGAGTGG